MDVDVGQHGYQWGASSLVLRGPGFSRMHSIGGQDALACM